MALNAMINLEITKKRRKKEACGTTSMIITNVGRRLECASRFTVTILITHTSYWSHVDTEVCQWVN